MQHSERLEELFEGAENSELCAFYVECENEDENLDETEGTICYASAGDVCFESKPLRVFTLFNDNEGGYSNRLEGEDQRQYYHWLLFDSPYKEVFIDPSVEEALKWGVVVRCDVPSNLMFSAMIAYRMSWEYGGLLEDVLRLHGLGIPMNAAFYLSHCVGWMRHKPDKFQLWDRAEGHTVVSGRCHKDGFVNFVNGTPSEALRNYDVEQQLSTIHALWGGDALDSKDGWRDGLQFEKQLEALFPSEEVEAWGKMVDRSKPIATEKQMEEFVKSINKMLGE